MAFDVNALVGALAYLAWLTVAGGIIASAVLIAAGREEGKRILFGTVAAAFVLAFFWTILTETIKGEGTVSLPYWDSVRLYAYAAAAVATIFSAIMMVRGRLSEGAGYLLGAILIVFMVNYGPQIFGVESFKLEPVNLTADIGINVGIGGRNLSIGVPVKLLVEMPDPSNLANFTDIYGTSQNVALAILGVAFMFGLVIRTFQHEDFFEALKQTSKDVIAAAILIYTVKDLYTIFATVINTASTHILADYEGTLKDMANAAVAIIAAGFATGFFVPALAELASLLLYSMFLSAMIGVVRYFAVGAALAVAPVLIALWVVPPLKGVVRLLFDLIVGLGLAGLIASAMLAFIAAFFSEYTLLYVASPLVVGLIPTFIGFGMATGMVPGVAAGMTRWVLEKAGSAKQAVQQAAGAGAAGAAAASLLQRGQGPAETRLRRPVETAARPRGAGETALAGPAQQQAWRETSLQQGQRQAAQQASASQAQQQAAAGHETSLQQAAQPVAEPRQAGAEAGLQKGQPLEQPAQTAGQAPAQPEARLQQATAQPAEGAQQQAAKTAAAAGAAAAATAAAKPSLAKRIAARSLQGLKTGAILTTKRTAERLEEWARAHGLDLGPDAVKRAEGKLREMKLRAAEFLERRRALKQQKEQPAPSQASQPGQAPEQQEQQQQRQQQEQQSEQKQGRQEQ